MTVSDHIVSSQIFMPGVGFLEIALAALVCAVPAETPRLKGVVFMQPWILPTQFRT